MGYSPWGRSESGTTGVTEHACRESDTAEHAPPNTHTHPLFLKSSLVTNMLGFFDIQCSQKK